MTAPRRQVPLSRVLRTTLVLGTPTAAAFVVLVLTGALGVVPAVIAGLAALVLMAQLVRLLMRDLVQVSAFLREEPDAVVPSPDIRFAETGRDVAVAAVHLRARARRRIAAAEAVADAESSLVRYLPGPLLVVDGDGVVVRSNPAARDVLGRDPDGKALPNVVRDPHLLEAVDRVLAGAQRATATYTIPGAVERNFEVAVERLPQPDDEAVRALVMLHDVTMLTRAEQMRADFVANASHELRTPLASILGFIETLRGPARDDREAHERFLGIMLQQAERMRRLIEDLLSLSRIELHEHTQPTDRFDLREVVESVVQALQIQADAKDMPLVVDAPEDLPQAIGEPEEIAQVVQNLLTNAIKYGRRETPVSVVMRAVERGPASMPHGGRGGCLALAVIDQGDGIAKEHLPRLTERFYRVDTARSRQLGGTGLGLAIVKHILNRHRGALTVESVVGEGSTFTMYLPTRRAEAIAGSSFDAGE